MEEFKIDLAQNEENAVHYEVYTEATGTGSVKTCFLCFVWFFDCEMRTHQQN